MQLAGCLRTATKACAQFEKGARGLLGLHRHQAAPHLKRICLCKYMIFRRLGPFFTFFTLFLSCKGVISRRLQRKHGINDFEDRK